MIVALYVLGVWMNAARASERSDCEAALEITLSEEDFDRVRARPNFCARYVALRASQAASQHVLDVWAERETEAKGVLTRADVSSVDLVVVQVGAAFTDRQMSYRRARKSYDRIRELIAREETESSGLAERLATLVSVEVGAVDARFSSLVAASSALARADAQLSEAERTLEDARGQVAQLNRDEDTWGFSQNPKTAGFGMLSGGMINSTLRSFDRQLARVREELAAVDLDRRVAPSGRIDAPLIPGFTFGQTDFSKQLNRHRDDLGRTLSDLRAFRDAVYQKRRENRARFDALVVTLDQLCAESSQAD